MRSKADTSITATPELNPDTAKVIKRPGFRYAALPTIWRLPPKLVIDNDKNRGLTFTYTWPPQEMSFIGWAVLLLGVTTAVNGIACLINDSWIGILILLVGIVMTISMVISRKKLRNGMKTSYRVHVDDGMANFYDGEYKTASCELAKIDRIWITEEITRTHLSNVKLTALCDGKEVTVFTLKEVRELEDYDRVVLPGIIKYLNKHRVSAHGLETRQIHAGYSDMNSRAFGR